MEQNWPQEDWVALLHNAKVKVQSLKDYKTSLAMDQDHTLIVTQPRGSILVKLLIVMGRGFSQGYEG